MKKYYPLQKIFHITSKEDAEAEYNSRISSSLTYITDLKINPFKNGTFIKEEYPLFFLTTKKITKLHEKVLLNSNHITKLQFLLPSLAQEKFFNRLLINELHSTNEIENIVSTKAEISTALNKKNSEHSTNIKKFLGLIKLYTSLNSYNFNIAEVKDFRKIYDILVSDEIEKNDKLDGTLFRKEGVNIVSSTKTLHKGITPEDKIIGALKELIKFYNSDIPNLYKYIVAHYFFEYIHPFYDGNGRVGRYIFCTKIVETLDKFSAITFSYTINRERDLYYKSFEQTSSPMNKGEVTFFIENILTLVTKGQENIISYLEENIEKYKKISWSLDRLIDNEQLNKILTILAQGYLFSAKDNLITCSELSKAVGISQQTLNKYFDKHPKKIEIVKKKPKIAKLKDDYVDELLQYSN